MPANYPLKVEEVTNNVVFKAVERALKNEFPWIIKIIPPTQEKLNEFNLIFIDLLVNPFMMRNYIGAPLQPWTLRRLLKKEGDDSPSFIGTILDVEHQDYSEIDDTIGSIVDEVQKSPVIPQHLKIPGKRKLSVSALRYPSGLDIPKEYLMDPDELWSRADRVRTTN